MIHKLLWQHLSHSQQAINFVPHHRLTKEEEALWKALIMGVVINNPPALSVWLKTVNLRRWMVVAKIETANEPEKFIFFQLRSFPFFQLRYQPHLAGDLTLHALPNGRQEGLFSQSCNQRMYLQTNLFVQSNDCKSRQRLFDLFRGKPGFLVRLCILFERNLDLFGGWLLYLFERNMGSICFWRRRQLDRVGAHIGSAHLTHQAANPDHDEWAQLILWFAQAWHLKNMS